MIRAIAKLSAAYWIIKILQCSDVCQSILRQQNAWGWSIYNLFISVSVDVIISTFLLLLNWTAMPLINSSDLKCISYADKSTIRELSTSESLHVLVKRESVALACIDTRRLYSRQRWARQGVLMWSRIASQIICMGLSVILNIKSCRYDDLGTITACILVWTVFIVWLVVVHGSWIWFHLSPRYTSCMFIGLSTEEIGQYLIRITIRYSISQVLISLSYHGIVMSY